MLSSSGPAKIPGKSVKRSNRSRGSDSADPDSGTNRVFVGMLRPEHLREGMTHEEAADLTWVTSGPDVLLSLHRQRGWSWARIERWLAETHERVLLDA